MSRMARTESVGDSLCPLCHEHTEIYAIGTCDHPICYKCSTRMRVLCSQMYCPICRGDLPQIVFLTKKRKYDEVNRRDCIPNRKYKILMEDESVEDAYEALLEHRCRICDKGPLFESFGVLQNHMRRVHTLFACDLCINHLKIFPFERKFYNRKDLAVHRRSGDPDNRSYRGHPLCRFCDERYMDSDELLRHLRKSHYFCHFCDANNSNEYFDDYPDLKEHFGMEHYLCQEGQCGSNDTRFTNAFASDIDLKAHKAAEHMGNMSRAQAKEMRTIDLNFQVAPRRRGRDASVISPEDYEEVNAGGRGHRDRHPRRNESRPDSYSRPNNPTPPPEVPAAPSPRPPTLADDFPTLGNGPAPYIPAAQKKPTERVEDFPSLSAHRSSGPGTVTSSSSIVSSSTRPAKSKPTNSQRPSNNFSSMAATATSVEATRPSSSSTQVRPSSAQSRPVNTSRPVTAATTSTTWATAKMASTEDFPTLGRDKKSKSAKGGPNLVSLGAWSKTQKEGSAPRPSSAANGRHSPPAVSKPSSLAALGRALCDDGEYPTLGGGGGSNGAGKAPGATWVQKNANAGKNKNKKSSGSSTPLGKTRDPTFNTKSKQEQPVVVNGVSENKNENKTEETKSKKKKKKQEGKQNDSKSATEDSGISLSSIASEIDSAPVMPVPEPEKPEMKQKQKKQDSPVLKSFSDSAVMETSTSSSQVQAPVSSARVPSPTEEKENQEWETVATRKFKGFQEEDFPSLRVAPKKTAPPPGFQKPAKITAPPPGLNKPAPTLGRMPPGLSSVISAPPALSPSLGSNGTDIPLSVKLNVYNYATPSDAPDRNRALVARVRELLEPKFAGFDQFRTMSADYRSGQMTAQAYHKKCQDLFGKERFLEVLPELVALLPDLKKQHELAQAHKQDVLGICAPLDLQACPTCQQLLKPGDLTAHLASHTNLASDFAGFSSAASLPIKT
ncbi:E3 ubiquitin-protein ligase ZNF598-like [Littorina saxatilis]|uniref:RING-type E3 ubiquitin transferase n=1 Tax=Littorina saxatilis TaxID=31220 RepID=A0AAN9BYJ0_9CAEN